MLTPDCGGMRGTRVTRASANRRRRRSQQGACCAPPAAATLATNDEGQPFASLVTPATAADARVLLLLSGLSRAHAPPARRAALLPPFLGAADRRQPANRAPPHPHRPGRSPSPTRPLKARWLALPPLCRPLRRLRRLPALALPRRGRPVRRRLRQRPSPTTAGPVASRPTPAPPSRPPRPRSRPTATQTIRT